MTRAPELEEGPMSAGTLMDVGLPRAVRLRFVGVTAVIAAVIGGGTGAAVMKYFGSERGPAGPQGPAGARGPAGAVGPRGRTGLDGVDGANGTSPNLGGS